MSKGKFALGAAIGAVIGVVAGFLTAPKSGKETRADIKAKATAVKDEAVKKGNEVKDKAEEVIGDVRGRADDVIGDVKGKAVDLKERAENAVEGAKKGFNSNNKKK